MSRYEHMRRSAYRAQGGLCWYCSRQMWERTIETKQAAAVRFPGMTRKERAKLICTTEHLKRLADGGAKGRSNIVAACAECNHTRGETEPELYRERRLRAVWAS